MLTKAPALLLHDRRHQPCQVNYVEQDHVETLMPVGIGDLEQSTLGWMAGAVDDGVDPPPARKRSLDHAFEHRLVGVRAGETEPAERNAERLALAGGLHHRDLVALCRQFAGAGGADAAARRCDDRYLAVRHAPPPGSKHAA